MAKVEFPPVSLQEVSRSLRDSLTSHRGTVCALGKDTAARFVLWAKTLRHGLCFGLRNSNTICALVCAKEEQHDSVVLWAKTPRHGLCFGQRRLSQGPLGTVSALASTTGCSLVHPASESTRNPFFFFPGVDASRVYVRAWALGCFYSHISTRTFRRALTASVDSCAEIKSAPSVA